MCCHQLARCLSILSAVFLCLPAPHSTFPRIFHVVLVSRSGSSGATRTPRQSSGRERSTNVGCSRGVRATRIPPRASEASASEHPRLLAVVRRVSSSAARIPASTKCAPVVVPPVFFFVQQCCQDRSDSG